MNKQKLKEIYLNWKGLAFIHSSKFIMKWIVGILAIIFIFISIKITNYYVLGISLVLFFLQILSENKKDYYLKYGELFEKLKNSEPANGDKKWLNFLENVSGLNSIQISIFSVFLSDKFEKEISS